VGQENVRWARVPLRHRQIRVSASVVQADRVSARYHHEVIGHEENK
jgi:hypothetical protein